MEKCPNCGYDEGLCNGKCPSCGFKKKEIVQVEYRGREHLPHSHMKDETYCCEDFANWVKKQVYHDSGNGTWLMVSYLKTTRYVTLHYCPSCGQKLDESESLMANIIIPKGDSYGKTRSEQEENLRKDWGGSMNEEQLDKLKFLERKRKEKFGFDKQFVGQDVVDEYFKKTQGHDKRRTMEEMKREAERLQGEGGGK